MKKFLALILALVMVFSLAGVAFADVDNTAPDADKVGSNDVYVEITDGAASKIYYVTIEWETLKFEYNKSLVTWDPQTHTYNEGTNGVTGWVDATIETAITVTNHSNDDVLVDAAFASGDSAVKFGVTATVATEGNETLTSADAPAYYDKTDAASVIYSVSVEGTPDNSYDATQNVVGTITVTITAA